MVAQHEPNGLGEIPTPISSNSGSVKEDSPECVSVSSRSEEDGGSKDSGSDIHTETQSEASSETSKKLISKPILGGKTFTTILYEVIASIDEPISIKYFQVDTTQPRKRDARFKIECHLNDKLYGIGEGSSKKAAKQLASQVSLDKLLDERPHLRQDVGRVRKGFPSKKKLHTRRRRVMSGNTDPNWRRQLPRSYPQRPTSFDPFFEMQERRRLALEYEAVNRVVANIEQLSNFYSHMEHDHMVDMDYLGYDGMTPYESSLLNEHPSYCDSSLTDFQRALMMEDFERSLYGDMERTMNRPDTFEFMRKMQARSSKTKMPAQKLNVQAQEFQPKKFKASHV
jgi:hypothetical protein